MAFRHWRRSSAAVIEVTLRLLRLTICLAAALLVPTQSFAQIYIGGYGGVSIPHDSDAEVTIPGLDLVNSSGEFEFDPAVIAGARLGYFFENFDLPWLGVEFDAYWTNPELDRFKTAGLNIAIDDDLNVLSGGINGLVRYPYGPIQPYAGVGVGVVYADLDKPNDEDVVASLQLVGGVRGFVSDNLALFAEYKWVLTEFEFNEAGESLEVDYTASNIYGGVEWHFGNGGVHQQP